MNKINLENRVAIVTGGAQGFGLAITKRFIESGARVLIWDKDTEYLNKVDLKNTQKIEVDVSNYKSVENAFAESLTHENKIDILINNAGITRDGLIMRMNESDWNEVIDINLKGAFNTIKAVSREMMKKRSGRIINISSIVGLKGNSGQANYSAAKAGLIGLTKSTAKELASRSITVNCIAPGYIETDMTDKMPSNLKEELSKKIPIGKIGQPHNIASAALFLASDEAEYITGQTISVDGGLLIN